MRKVLALALAASLSLVGIGFAQAANPKAGTKCAKANLKVTYSGKTFTCVKRVKLWSGMQAYQLQSQLQVRQSLKVFSALKEVRPQKMQIKLPSTALRVAMERVHGVHRASKVLVEVQERVVEVQERVVEVQEPQLHYHHAQLHFFKRRLTYQRSHRFFIRGRSEAEITKPMVVLVLIMQPIIR